MSDKSLFVIGTPKLDPACEAAAEGPAAKLLRKLKGSLRRTETLSYNTKTKRKLNRVRLIVQSAFLLLFFVLFGLAVHPYSNFGFLERLMQLDPLPWIATSLASKTWARGAAAAIGMVVVGLFVGRFFCSMICPLGALIDLTDWMLFKRIRRSAPFQWLNRWRNLKFWILGYLLLAAALGHMHIHYFDPLAIVVRIFTIVLWPLASLLFFLGFDAFKELAGSQGWQGIANQHIYAPRLLIDGAAIAMIAVVFGGQLLQSRFWCRNLCPVGALFGVVSRPAAVDGVVDSSCIDCKICVHTCTMNAIDLDPAVRFGAECIQCNTCVTVCPTNSIKYVPRPGAGLMGLRFVANLLRRLLRKPAVATPYVEEMPTIVDQVAAMNSQHGAPPQPATVSRRSFLKTGVVAAGVAGTAATLGFMGPASAADVLRPPGSAVGKEFLDLCIRCEACIKVCTYNALVAMPLSEGGLDNLWTPRFEMRQSACDTECNACGIVCPTAAIKPLPLPDKQREIIGVAEVIPSTCLLWKNESCDICVDACKDAGYDAIEFYFADGFEKIAVLAERCTGCGWCEYHCPVGQVDGKAQDPAAIIVRTLPFDKPRTLSGSIAVKESDSGSTPGDPATDEDGGFDFDDEGIEEEGPGEKND